MISPAGKIISSSGKVNVSESRKNVSESCKKIADKESENYPERRKSDKDFNKVKYISKIGKKYNRLKGNSVKLSIKS